MRYIVIYYVNGRLHALLSPNGGIAMFVTLADAERNGKADCGMHPYCIRSVDLYQLLNG